MSINSFRTFLSEEQKTVYFTFGRMNPPTIGHGLVMDKLKVSASRNPYRIFVSQSQDKRKNPLDYKSKIKYIRKMFPKHSRSIVYNKKIITAMDAATALYNEGYVNLVMVTGSDRVKEFDVLLKKYNGVQARHGFYNFKTINVISAGTRDPDADGVSGISASKQREAAKDDDFIKFSQGVPKTFSDGDAKALFNDIRRGLGLTECTDFCKEISFKPISDKREQYVKGELFEQNDPVKILSTNEIGRISYLGTNYVIVEFDSGKKSRKWLDDVEKISTKPDHSISEMKRLVFKKERQYAI